MTPEQIAALTAISTIISKVGTWPIGSVVALVVLGPWIFMGFISYSMQQRHTAAIRMYEENVKLVLAYERVATGLQDIVVLSTQVMTQVRDKIDANLYCPLMRKDPKVEKTI